MNNERKVDNTLFITTLAGAVLFIVAIVGTILSVHHAAATELSALLLSIPGTSSALLLRNAIKKERHINRHADVA